MQLNPSGPAVHPEAPPSLRRAILDYYRFMWSSIQALDENSVLVDLPPILQLQIDIAVNKSLFTRIALFKFFPQEAILMMVQRLQVTDAAPTLGSPPATTPHI